MPTEMSEVKYELIANMIVVRLKRIKKRLNVNLSNKKMNSGVNK